MLKSRNVQHIQAQKFLELVERKSTSPVTHLRLTHCSDIAPLDFPIFPECKLLMIDNCDKNFFNSCFHRQIFPKVEHIWINNHPCTYEMHLRFAQPIFNPPFVLPTMFILKTYQYRYFTVKKASHQELPTLNFIDEQEYIEQVQKFNKKLLESQTEQKIK